MGENKKEKSALQKGGDYVKFQRLLAKAEADGRLDGKYPCPVCGMRYIHQREADECCRIIAE